MTLSVNGTKGILQIKRSDGTQLIGSDAVLAKNLAYKLANTVTLNSSTPSYEQFIGYESGQYNILANVTTSGALTTINNITLALNCPIILQTFVTTDLGYVHDVLTTTAISGYLKFMLQRIAFNIQQGASYHDNFYNIDYNYATRLANTYDFNTSSPLTVTLTNVQVYSILDQT